MRDHNRNFTVSFRYSVKLNLWVNLIHTSAPVRVHVMWFVCDKNWRHHSVACLTTGPQPLPKRVLHRVWSSASYFNLQYPLFTLRLSSSCLCLLPRLPVTSILPSLPLSLSLSLNKVFLVAVPTQDVTNLVSLFFVVCGKFLSSLNLCNTSSFFYIHESVLRESKLIIVQQDATYSAYYIAVGSSTCFGCWHPSSGARTTVITASGID